MGGCCFTPKKTHFLWWYWILLATVVGLPMFFAVRYVARALTEQERILRGRGASRIFWWGSLASLMFLGTCGMIVLYWVVSLLYHPQAPGTPRWVSRNWTDPYIETSIVLLCDFVGCLILANAAVAFSSKVRRLWLKQLVILPFLALWVVLSPISLYLLPFFLLLELSSPWILPVTSCLMFAAALIPAHFWRHFLERPEKKTARASLAALVLGALLFHGAAQYGQLVHLHLYKGARGQSPPAAEVKLFRMR